MAEPWLRLGAAAIALLAWGGLALQLWRVRRRLGSVWAALRRMSLFFTVLANLAVAIGYTAMALGVVRARQPLLLAGLALTMLLVGVVAELMRRREGVAEPLKRFNNAIQHGAVPLLCVAAWFFAADKGALGWRDPWVIALFPLVYLLVAQLRGALGGAYPYPFLDPDRAGWGAVARAILAIGVVFLLAAYGLVALDHLIAEAGRR